VASTFPRPAGIGIPDRAIEEAAVRVIFLLPYPLSSASGVAVFVRRLSSELRSRGHEVIVEGAPTKPSTTGVANLLLVIRSVRLIWKNRHRADVVHLQQLHPQSAIAGLVARLLGLAVVTTIHGRSPVPGGLRGQLFLWAERVSRFAADRLVFVAHSLRTTKGRSEVIPCGVHLMDIRSGIPSRDAVRKRLELGDAITFLFLGRVTWDKGFHVLLRAFARVRKDSLVPLKLLVVGPTTPGILEGLGETLASLGTDVVLVGEQQSPWPYVAAANILVLPSFHEGLPLSLLEAMGAGLAAIASRVGDIPHVVRPGETGWLVNPGDENGLAAAIHSAASDPGSVSEMGRHAAETIASQYDMGSIADRYERLYSEVRGA